MPGTMLMYRLLQGRAGDLRFAPALIPGCYPCVPLAPAGRTGAVSQPVAICENVRSDGMWITRGPVSFSPVADYDALRDRHGEESTVEDRFEAVVGAGTLMSGSAASVSFPHRWTPEGVTVDADFTGGHLLHLAAAGCVLNDLYREAAALGIGLRGARVTAGGGFNPATGSPQASATASRSAPMRPRPSSPSCLRRLIRWPRYPVPSGPEPLSSGSAEPHSDRVKRCPAWPPAQRHYVSRRFGFWLRYCGVSYPGDRFSLLSVMALVRREAP